MHEEHNDNEVTTGTLNNTTATKEKRSWFHSLTRRKKSQSETALAASTSFNAEESLQSQLHNNNNEPTQPVVNRIINDVASTSTGVASGSMNRKRKEEKNAFQRFRKRMGLRLQSLRHFRNTSDDDEDEDSGNGASGTTDASAEFLTQSPIRQPALTFTFQHSSSATDEREFISFTNNYKRFIVKKWLENSDTGPNHVMYQASSEMLSQVWYWGEISRRDAQKQLTDKSTGSFLVRDSESRGCQFTLSFRIVNVTLHYRLEFRDEFWHFEELKYDSIVKMIEDILRRCTNDNFLCFVKVPNEMQPPFPVILKYPLSRYANILKLQDLCRRVLQKNYTTEDIAKLPIPISLYEYLCVKRELVFQN